MPAPFLSKPTHPIAALAAAIAVLWASPAGAAPASAFATPEAGPALYGPPLALPGMAAVGAAQPTAAVRAAARRGDPRAQVAIGDWLTRPGARADWRGALVWYRKAARRGDVQGLRRVAACLEAGRGCRRDVPAAWRVWLAAAHGPDEGLRLDVARRLLRGEGVRRDRALARRLLAFGAARGDRRAQRRLGEALLEDATTDAERLAALRWLTRAARAGEPGAAGAWARAAARLAEPVRARAEADAVALGRDAAETAALERAAATDATAMMRLARRHLGLDGASPGRPDPVQAEAWYRRAAARGRPDAMVALADLTGPGGAGPRDEAGSLAWLVRAARAGSVAAMRRVGDRIAAGSGTPVDPDLARRWWRAAAVRGDATAELMLALADPAGLPAVGALTRALPAPAAAALPSAALAAPAAEAAPPAALAAPAAEAAPPARARASRAAPARPAPPAEPEQAAGAADEAARLRALADDGAAWAQTALGHALARGRLGAPDPEGAATWWLKAAAAGDPLAQANLAEAFAHGLGVAQDDVKAYGYWCLAHRREAADPPAGYPYAARLSADQVAEAGRQLAAWREKYEQLPPDPAPLPSPTATR